MSARRGTSISFGAAARDLDGRKAARLDGIGDVLDDPDLEVIVAALILDLVAARVRREDGLAIVDDWRELWIRLEMAQEAQRRRVVDGLVKEWTSPVVASWMRPPLYESSRPW